MDSKLTTGGAYVTEETITSFNGYYRDGPGKYVAFSRSFVQFDGEGDTANARPRAIGGHPAVLLRGVCLRKNPDSPYANKDGYVRMARSLPFPVMARLVPPSPHCGGALPEGWLFRVNGCTFICARLSDDVDDPPRARLDQDPLAVDIRIGVRRLRDGIDRHRRGQGRADHYFSLNDNRLDRLRRHI